MSIRKGFSIPIERFNRYDRIPLSVYAFTKHFAMRAARLETAIGMKRPRILSRPNQPNFRQGLPF